MASFVSYIYAPGSYLPSTDMDSHKHAGTHANRHGSERACGRVFTEKINLLILEESKQRFAIRSYYPPTTLSSVWNEGQVIRLRLPLSHVDWLVTIQIRCPHFRGEWIQQTISCRLIFMSAPVCRSSTMSPSPVCPPVNSPIDLTKLRFINHFVCLFFCFAFAGGMHPSA